MNIPENIKALGFDESFSLPEMEEDWAQFSLARVSCVHQNLFTVNDGKSELLTEISGRLFANASSSFDYPVVGDWVLVDLHNGGSFAIIHAIIERKSILKRKSSGRKVDFQLIAANLDTAFIVQSLNANFNVRRLERYLVMANDSNIRASVLLSKCDLVTKEEAESKIAEIKDLMPDVEVTAFSNIADDGVEKIRALMVPGKTYCLLGSSGVGKTTLLNGLIGKDVFATKEIKEKDDKGRHATTSRQLIKLESGVMVIDTPGMRELGNFAAQQSMDETFVDITTLADECRFGNCSHINEKGCAVLAALKDGSLPKERYRNYIKMTKEAAFNQMSYVDKRRKDKNFARHCKQVLKSQKNNMPYDD